MTELCLCANENLRISFRTVVGYDAGVLGMIMVIHTFGDYARFHLYATVADGLFQRVAVSG